jgi:carbonic anhydrase
MKTRTATFMRQPLHALYTAAAVLALATSALVPTPGRAQAPAPAAPGSAGPVTQPVTPPADVMTNPVQQPMVEPSRVEGDSNTIADQIKDAMSGGDPKGKQLNIYIDRNSTGAGVAPGAQPPKNPGAVPPGNRPATSAQTRRAEQQGQARLAQSANSRTAPGIVIRAKPLAPPKPKKPAEPPLPEHWSYEGLGGPHNWHKLKPEYAMCGKGKQQSPIAILDDDTLKGPAEPLQFSYKPSKGTVTDTGHGIEVKVYNTDNVLTVRNTKYRLQQLHFHAPAEEMINGQRFPLGAHLVHKNDMGQLAVVTVLFETGDPNVLIERIWTHMPLGPNDSVRMPPDLVNIYDALPQDQRYYAYFGSLTTPPCTEGVLWLVLKQPVQISPEQLYMYTQLYSNTARPLQPRNGRTIRDAITLTGAMPAN